MRKKDPDLTNMKFGSLTAIERDGADKNGSVAWLCRCVCGNTGTWSWRHLTSGNTRSCGCLKRSKIGALRRTHGRSRSPEYNTYMNMIARCENKSRPDYRHYGGRGIKVCRRWREAFENFLADIGPKPFPGASLDRYPDSNGDYEPENCRWTTQAEQVRNFSTRNINLTFNGKTQCLTDWAREMGMKTKTLHARITRHGWTVEQALTLPKQHRWSRRSKRNESV